MKSSFYRHNKKTWHHPSVIHLMDEVGNTGSPEQTIIQKAQEVVKCALKEGWTGPPFDPSTLASILGIRKTQIDSIDGEAQIVSINDQFELMFRRDVTDKRLNFTICHEISHTLFPDCARMIHYRNTNRSKFDPEREIEFLCDIGAAEMLLPTPFFENDLKKEGISLISVNGLSEKYNASREAIIRRIPSTNIEPCAVVYLGMGFNKDELRSLNNPDLPFDNTELTKPQPKIRIQKVHCSDSFSTFLPKNKSVPNNSKLYDLLSGQDYVSTNEAWDISGFGKRHVEAVRLYNFIKTNKLGILALVH